jgi:hypothetical protein
MNTTLWQLGAPVTSIIRGPSFKVLPKRTCQIAFSVEAKDGGEEIKALVFEDVQAFKCTHLASLGSVSQGLRRESYGALISISGSPWLREVNPSYTDYCISARLTPKDLQHLMITFDDGPCYEVICGNFKAV